MSCVHNHNMDECWRCNPPEKLDPYQRDEKLIGVCLKVIKAFREDNRKFFISDELFRSLIDLESSLIVSGRCDPPVHSENT